MGLARQAPPRRRILAFVPDSLPPVAIRVARPYATEEELLERELDTLTRTSVTLLGAQSRPQGVVLRFELVLSNGQVLMRGEGRVVGYKPDLYDGLGGLTLRFTRLDSRTKAVVDRAAALRDRRRPSAGAPPLADAPGDLGPIPSIIPSLIPSLLPSVPPIVPSLLPALVPSMTPSMVPSVAPSMAPPSTPPVTDAPPSLADVLEPPSTPLLDRSMEEPERERSGTLPLDPPPSPPSTPPPSSESLAEASAAPHPPQSSPTIAKTDGGGARDRDALLERLRVRSKSLGDNALDRLLGRRR
jgi:hypothetical protein